MKSPDLPRNERKRLAALRELEILDTEAEPAFDEITALAAAVAQTPIALISLVDEHRQWFKSRHGIDETETSRDVSFCAHAVADGMRLVVPDARSDPRFADNPLVVGGPRACAYAGIPLVVGDGLVLGTLCVIDHVPRNLQPDEIEQLERLAGIASRQLQQRTVARRAVSIADELARVRHEHTRFFDLSRDMLCTAGPDGFFKRLNPAWETVLGYSEHELRARPFIEFVHEDDREATVKEAAALFGGEITTVRFENRYRHADGTYRWLLWSARYDPTTEVIMAVARDISYLKEQAEQLRESRDAATRANEFKSDFLARMSHELRTPLNSIIGFTSLILRQKSAALTETEAHYLTRVDANGRHLLQLINDILDLSKLEANRIETAHDSVDVAAVVGDALNKLEARIGESGNVVYFAAPRRAQAVVGDARRLEQVVINLVDNAAKFTSGGAIEVRIITAPASDEVLRLEVADSGVGISAADLPKIFEAFEQVETGPARSVQGTGLGLAISQALCQKMGFRMDAASLPGEGSVFALHFSDRSQLAGYEAPRCQPGERVEHGQSASRK